jgi:hypothetical protein
MLDHERLKRVVALLAAAPNLERRETTSSLIAFRVVADG